MTLKQISLFTLLIIPSLINANRSYGGIMLSPYGPTIKPIFENGNKHNTSEFQSRLDKFNQAALECQEAWIKTKEECEQAGNCETCPHFQAINQDQAIYETKKHLIAQVVVLNREATEFGTENLINEQRAIRRIIQR